MTSRNRLDVTPLGYGAFKIGRHEGTKYPTGYELPDDRSVDRLLNGLLDMGINYLDTAPAYGSSEERIGRFIGHRGNEYLISTKVGESFESGRSSFDFSADAVKASVERSLRRLRRDVLDLVFVHAPRDDVHVLKATDVVATLVELKDRGRIRGLGLSAHTVEAATMALSWADAVMIEYHAENPSMLEVLDRAAGLGVMVMVKKGLASGRLPPAAAIRHVLAHAAVTSLLIATLDFEHLRQNWETAQRCRQLPNTNGRP